MEFRIQDILKNIIPGMTIIIFLTILFYVRGSLGLEMTILDKLKDFSEIVLVFILGGAYFMGFIIDALASMLENMVVYRIFNRPSFTLLSASTKHKYALVNRGELVIFLLSRSVMPANTTLTKHTTYTLFKIANRIKDHNSSDVLKEKITEYYNSYIFVRNISCVCFISLLVNIVFVFDKWQGFGYLLIIQLFLFFIVIFRLKQRAYYYSSQVFNAVKLPND